MGFKQLALEFVDLVKVDRSGREYRESMPRWLAEIAIGCIPLEEPEVAYAKIEPIHTNPKAPYPMKPATPERIWFAALFIADFLPIRSVA